MPDTAYKNFVSEMAEILEVDEGKIFQMLFTLSVFGLIDLETAATLIEDGWKK